MSDRFPKGTNDADSSGAKGGSLPKDKAAKHDAQKEAEAARKHSEG